MKPKAKQLRISGLLLLLLPAGCQGVARYFEHRGRDLLDCFKLSVGAGIGLAMDVKVTEFFAPGLGFVSRTTNFGWDDREVNGVWEEYVVINTPAAVFEVTGSAEEERETSDIRGGQRILRLGLASVLMANERWIRVGREKKVFVERFSLLNFLDLADFLSVSRAGEHYLRPGETHEFREKSLWRKGWIEVGVTPLFLHARAGVNPFEMVDFALGILGMDPAGDDLRLLQ